MSTNPDEQDRIEEEAALWMVRFEEGLSTQDRRSFMLWYEADPRHAAAFRQLESTCTLLEELPQVRSQLPAMPAPAVRVRTRSLLGWLAGGLTVAALVVFIGLPRLARTPDAISRYTTGVGGFERVQLPDGSVVELNARTDIVVDFQAGERRLELIGGEAHFTVAHDTARPFTVRASGIVVRAVGTAFNVRMGQDAVEVLVTDGKVELAERADPLSVPPDPTRVIAPAPSVLVARNQKVVVPSRESGSPPLPAVEVRAVDADAVRAALSWQERRLVFSATPMRDAIDQFNRRNRIQVRIDDPALGLRPIGGTFAADNVEGFVRLLEEDGAVQVERAEQDLIVLRPRR